MQRVSSFGGGNAENSRRSAVFSEGEDKFLNHLPKPLPELEFSELKNYQNRENINITS